MNNTDLKRACLTVGLAASWGAVQADMIEGIVANVSTQGPMHFMYTAGSSGPYSGSPMYMPGSSSSFFPGGPPPKAFEATIDYPPTLWGTIGCIDVGRVSVGVTPGSDAGMFGMTFEDVFSGPWTEVDIYEAVITYDYFTLGLFCDVNRGFFSTPFVPGATSPLVDFSSGTPGGAVSLVPEPAALSTLGFGVLFLARRKRS